eukprot:scaffold1570_cov181-Pinguiococcus_pyrenoidosus.AAC.1
MGWDVNERKACRVQFKAVWGRRFVRIEVYRLLCHISELGQVLDDVRRHDLSRDALWHVNVLRIPEDANQRHLSLSKGWWRRGAEAPPIATMEGLWCQEEAASDGRSSAAEEENRVGNVREEVH